MSPEIIVALVTGILAIIGSAFTFYLTKSREDETKRLELTIEYYQRQVDEFYGPLFNLINQIVTLNHVNLELVDPNPELNDPLNDEDKAQIESFFREEYFSRLHEEVINILRTKLYLIEGAEMPKSFYDYLYHKTQQEAQSKLWEKCSIDTSHIDGKLFPDQFIDDINSGLKTTLAKYNKVRLLYPIFGSFK